jgi:hypothetical protein
LKTEPKPANGLMRWFSAFLGEAEFLQLAATLSKPIDTA